MNLIKVCVLCHVQESKSAAGSLARDVLEILQRNYPELHEHIMGVLSGSKQTAGHQASGTSMLLTVLIEYS